MMRTHDNSEQDLLDQAVRQLASATRFPLAFGGLAAGGTVPISAVIGNRTPGLQRLRIQPERGLGGRAMAEGRPRLTGNYAAAKNITHDYDSEVLSEGVLTLIAVPVVVAGRTRGILYGGAHGVGPTGDVSAQSALAVADALSRELQVRDEVTRRMALLSALPAPARGGLDAVEREQLRTSYAELRSIATRVTDPELRQRLEALEARLAGLGGVPAQVPATGIRLSPRETDVLSCAALGLTNTEIANTLALRETTVKSYLGSAMSKLDAGTRHAAVAAARRLGLIP